MSEVNLFELAARKRFRFDSPKGQLTVEDLFDLPLTSQAGKANLDDIAKGLYKQLQNEDISFVNTATPAKASIQQRLDLVKLVIAERIAENEANRARAERAARKEQLLEALAAAEQKELSSKGVEDLRKMIAELG